MVYFQGMYHQFEINVINAFYNKFWSQFGKFFKRSLIFAFGVWRKNEGFTFLICYLLVINVYCFFDLLLFQWSWYMVTAPAIFLMICSSVCDFCKVVFMLFCSSHLKYTKFRKKTQNTMFFFEKSWAKFFLKPFVFAIQF